VPLQRPLVWVPGLRQLSQALDGFLIPVDHTGHDFLRRPRHQASGGVSRHTTPWDLHIVPHRVTIPGGSTCLKPGKHEPMLPRKEVHRRIRHKCRVTPRQLLQLPSVPMEQRLQSACRQPHAHTWEHEDGPQSLVDHGGRLTTDLSELIHSRASMG
jgi:hypothetical protein